MFLKKGESDDLSIMLTMEDGSQQEYDILARFPVYDQQYIALSPVGSKNIFDDFIVYRFAEDENGDPLLTDIETDEEEEAVLDRLDELFDEAEYDDYVDAEGEDD